MATFEIPDLPEGLPPIYEGSDDPPQEVSLHWLHALFCALKPLTRFQLGDGAPAVGIIVRCSAYDSVDVTPTSTWPNTRLHDDSIHDVMGDDVEGEHWWIMRVALFLDKSEADDWSAKKARTIDVYSDTFMSFDWVHRVIEHIREAATNRPLPQQLVEALRVLETPTP
ncbi:MAG: hypothetical protein COV59_04600 [Candidatus Magasanikbacteria bacterium CG11_big_fil_rev_8_21_14_0_20_39_34]|uniref:Uncharacterized protein n=1 Tax=Candidatus Magasanikbacteria bacterium CG11_big_fil_rev_8_21_14_0_20_39_34 TaxID=1974653 RepID=A0A2H0N4A7_9BACT|nr:MAG: hypothetical protein COV59_04600 [Candidatus Magasanikbacteria bacterium CG11_big_fil_rev_8_21_14_0_20_39_34]